VRKRIYHLAGQATAFALWGHVTWQNRENGPTSPHRPNSTRPLRFAMPILFALSICAFAAALIIRIVDPVVPEIARDLASTPQHIALLASAFAFPYALGQPLLGPLGDAIGKAAIIKACLIVVAVALAMSAIAPNADTLFAARIVAGLAAGGTVPVSLAMVGDRFPIAERQVALSRLLMAMLSGQVLGALGAGVVGSLYGWRAVMWIGCAVITVAAVLAHVYLAPRQSVERKPFSLTTVRDGYRLVFANPRAKICYGAVFVGGLCIFGPLPYVATLLEARGAGSIREAGFVIAGLAVGGVIYALAVRRILSVLGGQMNMIRAGGLIAAVGFGLATLHLTWPQEFAAFIVIGVGFYMIHNSIQTQATELAPSARGASVSLHAFCFFTGQACGAPLFGLGFLTVGATTTLLLAALTLAMLGLVLAALLTRADASVRAVV
jgi:predicted MFS family arabinose efflux permease